MTVLMVVDKEPEDFAELVQGLKENPDLQMISCRNSSMAYAAAEKEEIVAAIIGSQLEDMDGLSFCRDLIRQYPMINCALTSGLDATSFHQITEGLGVFLQLPECPGREYAAKVLAVLESIGALAKVDQEGI